jgi:hypothetical protein
MSTDPSTPTALNEPVVADGIERVPFFNGRVLTAEDLKAEQDANAAARRRLGRALGAGVVDGLFVQKTSDTTVTVAAGFGLAPSGRVVELPQETEVSVVSSIEREGTAGTKGAFEDCAVQSATVTTGTGAYLLVAEPASTPRGRTPRTTLGGDGSRPGVAGECGAKRRVEGAKLRLVPFDTRDDALVPPSLADGDDSGSGDSEGGDFEGVRDLAETIAEARERGETPAPRHVSMLRNVLAHVCLRTPSALSDTASLYDTLRRQAQGEAADSASTEGPLDVLRRRARRRDAVDGLDDAVPLGLLYWSSDRIEFVDVWSVRRRVHRPDAQRPQPATARRRAEAEAALFQFQDHVADLVDELGAVQRSQLRASDYFTFLPPVGTVPIDRSNRTGLYPPTFFSGLTAREPLFLEGAKLRGLMATAPDFDAFRIQSDVLIWRYHVREDVQSGDADEPSYLVFANGFVPFAAEPQYNLSRWNYANYGPGIALR